MSDRPVGADPKGVLPGHRGGDAWARVHGEGLRPTEGTMEAYRRIARLSAYVSRSDDYPREVSIPLAELPAGVHSAVLVIHDVDGAGAHVRGWKGDLSAITPAEL